VDVIGKRIAGVRRRGLGIIIIRPVVKKQTSPGRQRGVGVMNLLMFSVGNSINLNAKANLLVDGMVMVA
jgi:hypothetical protein